MLSLTQLNVAGTFMNSACKTLRNYKKVPEESNSSH